MTESPGMITAYRHDTGNKVERQRNLWTFYEVAGLGKKKHPFTPSVLFQEDRPFHKIMQLHRKKKISSKYGNPAESRGPEDPDGPLGKTPFWTEGKSTIMSKYRGFLLQAYSLDIMIISCPPRLVMRHSVPDRRPLNDYSPGISLH